ncbi:hypothetical protein MRX96_056987 [Rhipicephalus microplus]
MEKAVDAVRRAAATRPSSESERRHGMVVPLFSPCKFTEDANPEPGERGQGRKDKGTVASHVPLKSSSTFLVVTRVATCRRRLEGRRN